MAIEPKKKRPPRMPGAAVTVPPMPMPPMPMPPSSAPPGRKTIEVQIEWLEIVDDATKKNEPKKSDVKK